MDDRSEEEVTRLLFAEEKVVTAVTLARLLNKPVSDANNILTTFYETSKEKKKLLAVYSICGEMIRHGISCSAVVLSKESDLEETKKNFVSVDSVDIFAVHLNEIKDVTQAIVHDVMLDEKFFRDDSTRAGIRSSRVGVFRNDLERKHSTEMNQLEKVINAQVQVKNEPKFDVKKAGKKQEDLSKLFEKACNREKTPKNSPVKVRESPFSSTKKKVKSEEGTPEPKPKRNRKIIIESEDEESSPQPKKAKSKLLDDDLFEAESPEKSPFTRTKPEEQNEPKKTKQAGVKKQMEDNKGKVDENFPLRRSPRKQVASTSGGKKKVMRRVVETFADEDGFLVTKEVLREVSVDPEEEEAKKAAAMKPLSPKKTNPPAAPKAKKATASSGQSKISSFFSKK